MDYAPFHFEPLENCYQVAVTFQNNPGLAEGIAVMALVCIFAVVLLWIKIKIKQVDKK